MGDLSDFLTADWVRWIASILAALFTFVAALAPVVIRHFAPRRPIPSDAPVGTGRREETRIVEAARELARQEWANRVNRFASGVLTAGQYLVAAALASSFIQTALPPYWVGVLGLIVLFSQVIQQRYRPDLRAIGAKERVNILRRLIRDAEDQLYASENKRDGAPSLYDIRTMVSHGIAEIERHESEELTSRIRAQVEPPETQRGA